MFSAIRNRVCAICGRVFLRFCITAARQMSVPHKIQRAKGSDLLRSATGRSCGPRLRRLVAVSRKVSKADVGLPLFSAWLGESGGDFRTPCVTGRARRTHAPKCGLERAHLRRNPFLDADGMADRATRSATILTKAKHRCPAKIRNAADNLPDFHIFLENNGNAAVRLAGFPESATGHVPGVARSRKIQAFPFKQL